MAMEPVEANTQTTADHTNEPQQFQYLVLRPFGWEGLIQRDEVGEAHPIRVIFTGGAAPQAWLPVFDNVEDAMRCSEDGKYPTLLLRKGRPQDIKLPDGIPAPCLQCGVIHWSPDCAPPKPPAIKLSARQTNE